MGPAGRENGITDLKKEWPIEWDLNRPFANSSCTFVHQW